jgi:hypothetical protein
MIPTAENVLKKYYTEAFSEKDILGFRLKQAMIEFAKLHVEAALKATAKMGKENWDWTTEECNSIEEDSYPLTNIK